MSALNDKISKIKYAIKNKTLTSAEKDGLQNIIKELKSEKGELQNKIKKLESEKNTINNEHSYAVYIMKKNFLKNLKNLKKLKIQNL